MSKAVFKDVTINGAKISLDIPPSGMIQLVNKGNDLFIMNEHGNVFQYEKDNERWTHLKGLDGLVPHPLKVLLEKLLP